MQPVEGEAHKPHRHGHSPESELVHLMRALRAHHPQSDLGVVERAFALALEAHSGQIRPHVSHVFPLSEFKAALRAKWSGEVIGGCVLHPQLQAATGTCP